MARASRERVDPRISVNDLALYMLSSETAKMGIIRRSKFPQTPLIIRYRDVRPAVCAYLADPLRRLDPLVAAEGLFRQRETDTSQSPLMRDDARASIEVIKSIQKMNNKLSIYNFSIAPTDQNKLTISGVSISARADLLVDATIRNKEVSGAAILRLTQDDAVSPSAISKRKEMGLYVATIARMHCDQNLMLPNEVGNRACMSIDIQHGELFLTPDATARRVADIENACRFIAAIWDSVIP